ncbi:MAG TPA: PGPGW domain-containing protein, partial [Candidatus Polarisedimenticolaceae bacterium]|nr:PGPGW domain-containing protein [Candidatus Polarisedimenticolaceae bacterium]
ATVYDTADSLSHEWWRALVEGFRSHSVLAGRIALISLGVAVIYAAVIFVALAWMRPDHFVTPPGRSAIGPQRHPVLRFSWHAAKNVLGAVLLLTGVAMLVLPGQGMLTILVALTLLEFPGKRRLVLRIVRRPPVHSAIDWLRARAGQPPIVLPSRDDAD